MSEALQPMEFNPSVLLPAFGGVVRGYRLLCPPAR